MYFKPDDILDIARQLKAGKVGIFPCDTILGIIAIPSEETVNRIQAIKKRPNCPFILLLSSKQQLNDYCDEITPIQTKIIDRYWPGPLTLIFKKRETEISNVISKSDSVGLRYPDFLPLNFLLDNVGSPIISTSVNLHKEKPALNKDNIPESILENVDFCYTDTGSLSSRASTIVDLSQDKLQILREGDIKIDDY